MFMLELKSIRKSYKTRDYVQHALNGVSIAFRRNEFASILGVSGSGKTTMLNIIGGLDQCDDGDLLIEGISTKKYRDADWDRYRNNRVGFVFQSYNLIPHQSILANVELALTLSGVSKRERRNRAIDALVEVGLEDHIHKLPTQLSGGQMQRVAIARALINDPEILLADEPTGALDTKTSDQVMKLLEEIAKDRLVIMVTHNPELAHAYTNRIIELKDGEIISDSNPYVVSDDVIVKEKSTKKTSMSFLTAISLSVSNLLTKKGRTFITAVAGSIGIIGIASILALASGINLYIESIEQETMSAYPLSIDASGIDITSFMSGNQDVFDIRDELGDGEVPVFNTISSVFVHQNQNDLKSFKSYIEINGSKIDPYVKSIQYRYGIVPQIFLEDEKASVRQVNPDSVFTEFGFSDMGGLEMISGASAMGMQNFNALPGDPVLFEEQYDVLEGRWPENKNEIVVVLTESGGLFDTTLYSLGLKDRVELEKLFEDFMNNEEVVVDESRVEKVDYQSLLNVKLKLVNPAEMYQFDETYGIWVNKTEDRKFMDEVIKNGMDLEVVGIVKVNEETKTPMLQSGLYYSADLTEYLINEASKFDIVKEQLDDPKINVFTGKPFASDDVENMFNFEDFISIDESKIQSAFNFDTSALNVDFSDLEVDFNNLPEMNLEGLAGTIASQINIPIDDVLGILTGVFDDFVKQQEASGVNDLETWINNFETYINSPKVQAKLLQEFGKLNDDAQITSNLSKIVQNYFSTYMEEAFTSIMSEMETQIERKMIEVIGSMEDAISVDQAMFASAFQIDLDEDDFFNLMQSLGERGQASVVSNLKLLGYRDLDDPIQINMYPKDFSTKEDVISFIDNYNLEMENNKMDEKVVKYTDFVGALMSSVTTIVNLISYALIAFVGISLVVSSIMIGVITYVSVLERIKEIGILRAIGASKKDIKRVFNAETLIIGFIAGGFGIFVTYLITLVANVIVANKFGVHNIAHLEIKSGLILILISMFLAFISGLIPASTAAKKDPVEALRSE